MELDIAELVPHAGKMLLLDRVIVYDEESLTAELTVHEDGLFDQNGLIPAWIGIEYMAQAVAAHTGIIDKLAGKPVRMGLLLGTRRYECNTGAFKTGSKLLVNVKRIVQDQGLAVFEGLLLGDGIKASAKLNVFQADNINEKINE